jgi:tetratricopeptide (TPR) repeat protein
MPVDSVQRAIDLLEKGRAEQAAPLLEDVVDAFPAYPGAYVLLGRAYEAGERWSRALDAWRAALWLVPDSPVALEGLRRSLRQGRRVQTFPAAADAESFSRMADLHRTADRTPREEEPEPPTEKASVLSDSASDQSRSATDIDVAADVEAMASVAPPAPSEPPARTSLAGTPADDNLERLISELEGARITPRPDIDQIPTPDFDDDIEDMVSETLARIYSSQGQHLDAARVYEALAEQHPERADYFEQKAAEMRDVAGNRS